MNPASDLVARLYCRRLPIWNLLAAIGIAVQSGMFVNVQADEHEQKGPFHRWVDSRPNQDLCKQLASEETQSWYRGFVMSRRLTQTEYRNAIRDVVGVPLQPDEEPPSDGAGGEGLP